MPPRSAFDRHFSREAQHQLAAWLDQHPTTSVDEFRDLLAERGLEVGRTTAHKEKSRLERMGERLRRSQRVMEQIGESLEGQSLDGRNRALTESTRTLVFELNERLLDREEGEEPDPKEIAAMTLSVNRMITAAQRVQAFGEAERKQLLDAAAKRADSAAKSAGLPPDAAQLIRAAIEGAV